VSGAQLFPVLLHHEDYFFACSHAASCLFPCAVTSSLARRIPFSFCMQSAASGHFPGACCVLIFFLIFLLPLCRQQGLPAPLSGHFEIFFCACRSFSHFTRAQSISFSLSGPSREWRIVFWCACRIFLHAASRHFSPCRVRRFFFFFLALHDDMRVENLLFGQQQGCACRNFFYFFLFLSGHFSSAVCAAFLFL
jgi:hypothetical protein